MRVLRFLRSVFTDLFGVLAFLGFFILSPILMPILMLFSIFRDCFNYLESVWENS